MRLAANVSGAGERGQVVQLLPTLTRDVDWCPDDNSAISPINRENI